MYDFDELNKLNEKLEKLANGVGSLLVDAFYYCALFAIGSMVVWSALFFFVDLVANASRASVADILLMFIYMELGAMVGIYFKTQHMPVRYLIYVSITALARLLVGTLEDHHNIVDWHIIAISGGILILSLSVLALRYASFHYPSNPKEKQDE